jgi:hypothetical protein
MKEKSLITMTPGVIVIELFPFVADALANYLLRQLLAPATVCSGQLTNILFLPSLCSLA